ncbi:PAS domain S-box protein [Streptomyces sp. NPDC005077]
MAFETAGAAIALLDSKGTVVGWSQAARRLVGYWAAEGVGQCGGVLLVAADDEAKASQAAVQSALWGRWSDHAQVRHRDGHSIDVRLCESALSGQDARARWSGPPTRLHSPAGARGHGSGVAPGQAAAAEPPADRHRHTRHATALHLGERHPGLQGRHPPSPVVGPQADGGRIRGGGRNLG